MGLKFISPGALAPWYTKVIPPVTRALEGWFCLDTAIERVGFNRAPGKANASIVGNPVVSANSVRFKGGENFLETQIKETEKFTYIVVGKVPGPLGGTGPATSAPYVGDYGGSPIGPYASSGTLLYHTTDTSLTALAWRENEAGTGPTSATATITDEPTSWAIRSIVSNGDLGTRVTNHTTGATANQPLATPRLMGSSPLRIGSVYGTNMRGETEISFVAIFSDALTPDEIALLLPGIRRRMLRFGIVV
ncbi:MULTISPECIES: hypothetical protein [Pseudomonas]|uniref:hypothetical protein n=1 Tax=Pseudomonas guariconensis TaxID=1288410 RepID=UPI002096CBF0|nr:MULTISPECIES: hypothetical protein [Pseudomonas]MCO7594283.1 hypothetical protein [Pseudomonas guariconensis]MCU7219990.1 hypothetical protein [Pseudomonas brassicacearum]